MTVSCGLFSTFTTSKHAGNPEEAGPFPWGRISLYTYYTLTLLKGEKTMPPIGLKGADSL